MQSQKQQWKRINLFPFVLLKWTLPQFPLVTDPASKSHLQTLTQRANERGREGEWEWEKKTADLSEKLASVERKTWNATKERRERKKQTRDKDEKSRRERDRRGSRSGRKEMKRMVTEEYRCVQIIPLLHQAGVWRMEQIQLSYLRACQRIGTETKAVIHGQVFEAVIEGNVIFVWIGIGEHDTTDGCYQWVIFSKDKQRMAFPLIALKKKKKKKLLNIIICLRLSC